MAGTLFGLGLSQQFDINGAPMSGCLLYIFQANSSTPVVAYKNVGLTAGQEHTFPIMADSTGRLPAFWLADGSYRARLTDAGGTPQFDEPNILALGPSSGGGGGGDTTDPNSVLITGDVIWRPSQGERSGFVRMNGFRLGSISSGGNYAAAANQNLFLHIWNTFSQTICPVRTGGTIITRDPGGALNDWNNNRTIDLLDMRGKAPFGFQDMGNINQGIFDGGIVPFSFGNGITNGATGGAERHTLTSAQLAQHQHGAFIGDDGHTHSFSWDRGTPDVFTGGSPAGPVAFTAGNNAAPTTLTINGSGSNGTGIRVRSGAGNAAGADDKTQSFPTSATAAHNNMPLFTVGTWYWRL